MLKALMPSSHVALVVLYGVENAGVRYIASSLRARGHRATLVLFKEWANNANPRPTEHEAAQLVSLLKERGVNVVGLSFGSSYFKIACGLVERLRVGLDVPIVFGGIHATVAPERCIEVADYVCVGEGEEAMAELADSLAAGCDATAIPNLWVRQGGQVVRNEVRPLVANLDALAVPSYGHEDTFLIVHDRVEQCDPLAMARDYRVYTGRGCLFRCAYCYNSTLREIYRGKGPYYRLRSPGSVIEELKAVLAANPRVRKIIFDDDVFVPNKEWIDEFLPRYEGEIGLPFECMLHPNMLDEGYLERLKAAGLRHLQVGIEAGSAAEGEGLFDRPLGQQKILDFGRLNRRLKIDVVYDVIVDNPLATEQDQRELVEFVLQLPRPFKMFIYSLTAFPKTSITRKLLAAGAITEQDVEGEAEKALEQFRITLDYPRGKFDQFILALLVLSSKSFVPKWLLRALYRAKWFERHPKPLLMFAWAANIVKMAGIALGMILRGELSAFKFRQYSNVSKMLTQ